MYKKICGIYSIGIEGQKLYIGSSVSIKRRWAAHRCNLMANRHHSIKLQRAWNKYGEQNFKFKILEEVEESMLLIEKEQFYIDKYDSFHNGYNSTPIAGCTKKRKTSNETRKKMSISRKKRIITDITRKRMSDSQSKRKGEKRSLDTCLKISMANRGRIVSNETREKMSLSRKGKKLNDKHKEKIAIKNRLRAQIPISEETRMKMSESAKKRVLNSPRNEKGDFIKYAFASIEGVMFENN